MRLLIQDSISFFKQARYAPVVDNHYRRLFHFFSEYLSNMLDLSMEKIDLERIYVIKDRNGNILTFRPLDHKIIDEYFRSVSHHKYSRLNRIRKLLGSFFRFLERNYHFPNPILKITFNLNDLKPLVRESMALSRHEILKLHHNLVQSSENLVRDLLLFCLLFSTGCRKSEILSLQVWQIQYDNDTFKLVDTKNGRQRFVVMMENMGALLKKYCEIERLNDHDYLFKQDNGRPLSPYLLKKLFDSYSEKAGISKFRIHAYAILLQPYYTNQVFKCH
jgi:site-specific recombinase XerD